MKKSYHKKDLCDCGGIKDARAKTCKKCCRRFPDPKEYMRQYDETRNSDPGRQRQNRNNWLFRGFGITLVQYENMAEKQGWVCFLCEKPETASGKRNLCVDHNDKTKKIRKLLCFKCNTSLGGFGHDPKLLRKAAEYLEEFDG